MKTGEKILVGIFVFLILWGLFSIVSCAPQSSVSVYAKIVVVHNNGIYTILGVNIQPSIKTKQTIFMHIEEEEIPCILGCRTQIETLPVKIGFAVAGKKPEMMEGNEGEFSYPAEP